MDHRNLIHANNGDSVNSDSFVAESYLVCRRKGNKS